MMNFIKTQKQRFLESKWYRRYRHSLKLHRWPLIDVAHIRFIEEQKQKLNRLFKK